MFFWIELKLSGLLIAAKNRTQLVERSIQTVLSERIGADTFVVV